MSASLLPDLHPLFRPVMQAILDETADKIHPSTIRLSSAWRSLAQQAKANPTLPIGFHCFGLAGDVAIIDPDGVYLTDGRDPRYKTFGTVAIRHGCVWGGSWRKADFDHCEYASGLTIAEYLTWIRSHSITLPAIARASRAKRSGLKGE